MRKLLLSIAFLMTILPACAVNWEMIDTDIPNLDLYIDTDSIIYANNSEYYYAIKYKEGDKPEKYAYLNTFHVGTGDYDGSFTNLKVSNMAITVTGNNELSGALRVLIKCGNAWVVGKVTTTNGASTFSIENQSDTDGIIRAAAFGKSATGDGEVTGDVDVDVYVYYEGSDAKVFSDNLSKINADGVSATVTFTATPATTAQGA